MQRTPRKAHYREAHKLRLTREFPDKPLAPNQPSILCFDQGYDDVVCLFLARKAKAEEGISLPPTVLRLQPPNSQAFFDSTIKLFSVKLHHADREIALMFGMSQKQGKVQQ